MKIVFDGLIYYLQKNGGISRYFDELIEGVSSIPNCEVVVLMRKNKVDKVFNNKVKIEIINSTIYSNNKFKKYLSVFIDSIKTKRFLKEQKKLSGCILHHTYYRYFKDITATQVVTIYDLNQEKLPDIFNGVLNKLFLFNKKKSIINADKLIAISEQTKKDVIETYHISQDKITVVHLGIDEKFKQQDLQKKENFKESKKILRPYFLFVGKRPLYKNFKKLIESFKDWEGKNEFDIITIGGGIFTKDELLTISELGLNNKIKNFEFVSDEDLVLFYNCSKSFIFPSLYEGFGLPMIEALACGTLVLASDIPVFKEIGKNIPIYFDPKKQESIVEALRYSLNDNSDRIIQGLKIAQELTWKKTVLKTLAAYKK